MKKTKPKKKAGGDSRAVRGANRELKTVALSCLTGVCVTFVILAVVALVMTFTDLPHGAITPITIAAVVAGCFAAGFFCGKALREKGLLAPERETALKVTADAAELEDFAFRRSLNLLPRERVTIVSPLPGSRYVHTPLGGEQRVALKAEGARLPVYWFVGGEFVGRQDTPLPRFWTLREGVHIVSLVDRDGRTASATVTAFSMKKGPEMDSGPGELLLTPSD